MTPTEIFNLVNLLVLPMWLLMLVAPKWKVTRFLINYKIIPLALSLVYAFFIIQSLTSNDSAAMDFSSLESVMALFTTEKAVLIGWIHYLAFDLVVGMWMIDQNRKLGIHQLLMVPCLIGTFMFGPVGFILFMIAKFIKEKKS